MSPASGGGRRRVAGERARVRPTDGEPTGRTAPAPERATPPPRTTSLTKPATPAPTRTTTPATKAAAATRPPGARPWAARSSAADAEASPPRRRVAVALAVLATLTALLVVAAVVVTVLDRQQQRVDDARTAAVEQARTAAETVLSYGYTTLDQDFEESLALSTGQFREDYSQTSEGAVREVATETEAEVRADVISAGVVSASADRVVVLMFVDQTTVSNRLDRPQTDQNRVRFTMVRNTTDEGPAWLVEQVEAL